MKASIIIPTYNRAPVLQKVLEALTRQTLELIDQIYVCDDGSQDDTAERVAAYRDKLPLSYLFQHDLGFRAGAARNMGIQRAATDILIFIDDDCIPQPGWLEAHLALHAHTPRAVAIGRLARQPVGQRSADTSAPAPLAPDERTPFWIDQIDSHPMPWLLLWSCHFSYNRQELDARFDERFTGWGMEDNDFGFQLQQQGAQFRYLEQAIVIHQDEAQPRSPFVCEQLGLQADYSSFLRNASRLLAKYPDEPGITHVVRDMLLSAAARPNDGAWVADLV